MARRRDVGPVPYEPHLIYEFCARLYARAAWIVISRTLAGIVLGLVLGLMLRAELGRSNAGAFTDPEQASRTTLLCLGACGVLVGAFGCALGRERAFWLRLEAQRTLCQLKIEENTRHLGRDE